METKASKLEKTAVLTGDLVDSSKLGPEKTDRAMSLLATAARDVAGWPEAAPTRFTRFRGDGWQFIALPPERALRAALLVIARLAAHPALPATRIAIGLGAADSLGTDDLGDAHGPAFSSSGRALEDLAKNDRLAIGGTEVTPLHAAILDLLDERTGRWTPEQAEAMAFALHPDDPTQADIAERLGISPQAVNYRLRGAGAAAIKRALHAWEKGRAT
ncbi:MAG: winged helix-turn-helix transcriptional regulator [Paracoccaceae bacterium]